MNAYVVIVVQFIAQLVSDGYLTEQAANIVKYSLTFFGSIYLYRKGLYQTPPGTVAVPIPEKTGGEIKQ